MHFVSWETIMTIVSGMPTVSTAAIVFCMTTTIGMTTAVHISTTIVSRMTDVSSVIFSENEDVYDSARVYSL